MAAPDIAIDRPPRAGQHVPPLLVTAAVVLEVALFAYVALAMPSSLAALGVFLTMQALLVVALVAPRLAVFAAMAVVGLSPDGWLADLGVTADMVVPQKLMMVGLAGLLVARFGLRADLANPILPFGALFAITSARPYGFGLTFGETARSFIGTVAPWTLGFARMPLYIAAAFLTMIELLPLIQVAVGALLEAGGIRTLLDLGGRLRALKNPPTLAHFSLWAIVVGTSQLLRTGRMRHMVLLGLNGLILLATGARAPTAYAALFCGACLLFMPTPRFGGWRRMLVLLASAVVLVAGLTAMMTMGPIRALDSETGASGRDLIWPLFVDAIRAEPFFGNGIGAARFVLDEEDPLAQLIGTTAAHNEYLRIATDVGLVGLAAFFASMVAWCLALSRPLVRRERFMLRFAFVIYAALSITDNTIISLTSLVFVSFVTAFSARGVAEQELRRAGAPVRDAPAPPGPRDVVRPAIPARTRG